MSHADFKKWHMSHVSVAYFPPRHISNLRNWHVAFHYHFLFSYRMSLSLMSPVDFKKINDHDALSNLRVEGHYICRG